MIAPETLLRTAVLLGIFALLGGCYGISYSVGTLRGRPAWVAAGYGAYALQLAALLALVTLTPLHWGWKALLIVSGACYYVIPPATLSCLERLHHPEPEVS